MLHFATLFDINYLSRGLALFESLTKYSSTSFRFYILALDDEVCTYFDNNRHNNIHVIPVETLSGYFEELPEARQNRSKIEFYFTLSPYLPLYIIGNYPDVQQITTMDADIYFYSDPIAIFERYADASILITPHNFSPGLLHLQRFGKYNVSFQSFKRDENGLACLEQWRNDCFNWCHDFFDEENNRFADQKYLDKWPQTFRGLAEIELPGAGLAPWNIENFNYSIVDKRVSVNAGPLIYFHFHQLRVFNKNFAFNALEEYRVKANRKAIRLIYHIYLIALGRFDKQRLSGSTGILRYNNPSADNLKKKIKSPDGYWIFNRQFIFHINPNKQYNRLKRKLKSLWPL